MFSKVYKKYVFIDFGISKFVKQDIGLKTLTQFVGTYRYACSDMKKLYFLKKPSYIDLYFNDLCGLLESFNQINRKI